MNNFELYNHWSETYRIAGRPKLGQIAASDDSSMALVYFSAFQAQKFEMFLNELTAVYEPKNSNFSDVKLTVSKFLNFINTSKLVLNKLADQESFLSDKQKNKLLTNLENKLSTLRELSLKIIKSTHPDKSLVQKIFKELGKTTTII